MTNTQILIEAKSENIDIKQLKKLSKLLKFVYPDSQIQLNKKGLSKVKLFEYKIIILVNIETVLTIEEVELINEYVKNKGNLLIFTTTPNASVSENLNFLLQDYSISINSDEVIRTAYKSGYYYPKNAFISDGVINRALPTYFKRNKNDFAIVFPFGQTVNCKYPAVPLMGTGMQCYPVNRPITAAWYTTGKVIVCASFQIILDKYLDLEQNSQFVEYLLLFLKNDELQLSELDVRDPGISEYFIVPHVKEISSQLQYGIEETESVDIEMSKASNKDVFHLNTFHVATTRQLYNSLSIPVEPVDLIPPEFSTPMPPLKLSLFPPTMRTTNSAPLELFDLDEQLADDSERLGLLVNKCTNDDLEYFILEAAKILDIADKTPEDIIKSTLIKCLKWKMTDSSLININ